MRRALGALALPFLLRLEPETAHRGAIAALRLAPGAKPPASDPRLAVAALGLAFANPLGMAVTQNNLYIAELGAPGAGPNGEVANVNETTGTFNGFLISGLYDPSFIAVSPIPEPGPRALVVTGAGLLCGFRRFRRSRVEN